MQELFQVNCKAQVSKQTFIIGSFFNEKAMLDVTRRLRHHNRLQHFKTLLLKRLRPAEATTMLHKALLHGKRAPSTVRNSSHKTEEELG